MVWSPRATNFPLVHSLVSSLDLRLFPVLAGHWSNPGSRQGRLLIGMEAVVPAVHSLVTYAIDAGLG